MMKQKKKYNTATPERVREWKARHKFIEEHDVNASVFMQCHKFVKTAEASKRAAAAASEASSFATRKAAAAMRTYVVSYQSLPYHSLIDLNISGTFDWTKRIRQNTGLAAEISYVAKSSRNWKEEWTRE